MKIKFTLLACCICFFIQKSYTQETGVPFTIEVNDVTPNNWPGLHSFAFAEWDDLWIFIGGRTNGLHGFFLATGFPVTSANDEIWVMDHVTGDIWTYDVNQLSDELAEVLRSTNGQFTQNGNYLYMTGGYGKSLLTDEFTTFPSLTAIDLSVLVPAVINGISPSSAFQQITDERVQVCGGELHQLGGDYYLVGGNDFSGRYSDDDEPEFVQQYTNEIKKFNISHENGNLAIINYTTFGSEEHYHRRDFSLAPIIFPGGNQGLAAYGGVFRIDANLPFVHPIYISENDIQVDQTYAQKMSHYTCPVIPMYDAASQNMYSIFFGGISWNYYDHENDTYIQDDLVPFIDDITTLVKYADGTSTEVVLPVQFDQYLGSNAKFIPSSSAPYYDNEVVQLDQISDRILLGHIYGGIHAQLRNFTPSSASNRVFAIYLTPAIPLAVDPDQSNFTAHCQEGEVELNWSVSSDISMDYFEVEYAEGLAKDWTFIRRIEPTLTRDYSFVDKNRETGIVYYRLKRVLDNGSRSYSPVVSSNCNKENILLTIVPNPAREEIEVVFPEISDIYHPIILEISNMYGQVIQRKRMPSDLKIDVQIFPKGLYQLKLKTAKGVIGMGRFLRM